MSVRSFLLRPAIAFGLALTTPSAEATERPVCAERTAVVKRLEERYGERLQSLGMHRNKDVLEVYASDTGSWSILVTRSDGMTCLIAAGQSWETAGTGGRKPGKDV